MRRNMIQPSRKRDYLYDPVYMLAGEQQDHARATKQALTDATNTRQVPIFRSMFSDLLHYPRHEVRLKGADPVPGFISRQWRGNWSVTHDTVLRLRHEQDSWVKFNRYVHDQQRADSPFLKVAQTQTAFRDSEAQTDPYSPEYIQATSLPELISLALLSYGCGLPAGLVEVEMIERARAKRAWEANLPDLHDVELMDKRRKKMEQQEIKEWLQREQEIDRIQEERLKVLVSLLRKREQQHAEVNSKHTDKLWGSKQEIILSNNEKIKHERARVFRRIAEMNQSVKGKLKRKTLVELYSDVGSQVYAPSTRIGLFVQSISEQRPVKNTYQTSFTGLLELEKSLPDFVMKPVENAPQRTLTTHAGFVKRKFREENQLADIHKTIQDNKLQRQQPPKPLSFVTRVEKSLPPPSTPSIGASFQVEGDFELAVILLQQMIRGRSVQNLIYESKEKRNELIQELRSTQSLQAGQQKILKDQEQENYINEYLGELEGASLSNMLDGLNKELIQLQQERRIQALSMLAERERRKREVEESGFRQVEERRRREHDEIFKQIVKIHQSTVDTYLEDIIMSALELTASARSRIEIRQLASQVNEAAYAVEKKQTSLSAEEIVSELIHGFMLPEVQKQAMKERVHQQQQKYISAAQREVDKRSSQVSPAGDNYSSKAQSAIATAVSVVEPNQSRKSSSARYSSRVSLARHDSNGSLQLDMRPYSDSPQQDQDTSGLYTTSERDSSRQDTPVTNDAGDHSRLGERPSLKHDQFDSTRTASS